MNDVPITVRISVEDVRKLERDPLFLDGLERVSAYRRGKVLRLHFRHDRNLSLGAGLLLDSMLAAYGLREKDLTYVENAFGKPCISGHPEIGFSLSHAGDFAACAVCTAGVPAIPAAGSAAPLIGIDVEPVALPEMDVVRCCLSDAELKTFLSMPESSKADTFTRLWTLKESFLKAVGTGIAEPFPSFAFKSDGHPRLCGEKADSFRFFEFSWTGYRGCLCTSFTPLAVKLSVPQCQ